ncbi:VTC domain-containing protein [Thamnidium elegans]|uniref:SPX domain-containing protein n=1 Tax=Thamnidium elegans TaxID=101142 RepID=A0A8H7SWK9_9FUNG|nr:hypothetical protein INT48_007881 [Thamnidium elegans]KAI8092014.1 VTC domain-containing protein [Thamnidium elegans]
MKFGQHLHQNQFSPWKNEYINYDQLKHFLKERQLCANGWTGADEHYFSKTLLVKELDKVNVFIHQKMKQAGADARKVTDLIQFININDIGFYKILKKHDKWTEFSLLGCYDDMHQQFQSIIRQLDSIKRKESLKESVLQTDKLVTTTTTKYWVHTDNLAEVQAILLFHLPASSDIINTVYFDNPTSFILYSDLLERNEDAELIRARWYGTTNINMDIYFERKIHQESWLHNKGCSTTDRFRISQPQVETYLALGHDNNNQTSKRIFQSMQKNKLRSTMRTYHHRTTYSANHSIRISVDSKLTFIKEQSATWKRNDVGDDYPFEHLNREHVNYFPYAVLEIKTTNNASVPEWLTHLVETSQLVYEVPYFSKYMHGISFFFREKIPLLPWWLGEMNIDIRKKSSYATIQSQHNSGPCVVIEPPLLPDYISRLNKEEDDDKKIYNNMTSSCTLLDDSHIGLTNTYARSIINEKSELSAYQQFLNCTAITKLKALREKYTEGGQPKCENYVSMMSWLYAKVTNNQRVLQSPQYGSMSTTDQQQTMPKKGKLKKKVEPKLFFSNERTFISWLQFSALLLSVSLGLLNFGDSISKGSGGFFILLAVFLAAYAQLRFQYRAWQIRFRGDSRFDDIYGPAVLCIVLVIALFVNLALRVNQPLPQDPSLFGYNANKTIATNDTMLTVDSGRIEMEDED